MKKILALLFLSTGATASDATMMEPDVIGWKNPNRIIY